VWAVVFICGTEVGMSVDSEAAAIVRDAMKPPRKMRRRQHRHCIYCTIVVDEAVPVKGDVEREPFSETPDGPVCDRCRADPLAMERMECGEMQGKRRAIFSLQIRQNSSLETLEERDIEIVRMHDAGMTYTQIGALVGMTKQGAATAAGRMRARMAEDAKT